MVNDMLDRYWYAEYDDHLFYWGVYAGVGIQSWVICTGMSKRQATHVAHLHNKWYQNDVYLTYLDNIELTAHNDYLRAAINQFQDDPEQQRVLQECLLTDISQLDKDRLFD